jgi:hypothetical protein
MASGPQPTGAYPPIEDYAIIGDLHTGGSKGRRSCCLVTKLGQG